MELGCIERWSVCLESELPKQETEGEVRRNSGEGSEANITIATSNPKILVRPLVSLSSLC